MVTYLYENLQAQSVPIFIRQMDSIPKTANFKENIIFTNEIQKF